MGGSTHIVHTHTHTHTLLPIRLGEHPQRWRRRAFSGRSQGIRIPELCPCPLTTPKGGGQVPCLRPFPSHWGWQGPPGAIHRIAQTHGDTEPRALSGPGPPADTFCTVHSMPACAACKRLRLSSTTCCAKGHHQAGYIDRQPLSKVCAADGLRPCPRCMLLHRGVCHCCSWGLHKVCTPVPTRKRPAPPPVVHCKRPCPSQPGPRNAHSLYTLHR